MSDESFIGGVPIRKVTGNDGPAGDEIKAKDGELYVGETSVAEADVTKLAAVTATAAEINVLAGVAAGTPSSGDALVLDADQVTLINALDTADGREVAALIDHAPRVTVAEYDFADLAGAQGAITLTDEDDAAVTIPDNHIITRAWVVSETAAASGGSATIALGFTGDADAFIGATAFDNAAFAGSDAITALTNGIPIKTTAAVSILATVADADLTAGKFRVNIEHMPDTDG